MARPEACPECIFEMVEQTWHADPNERPTFGALLMGISNASLNIDTEEKTDDFLANKLVERFDVIFVV
jgi:hypothetical protein